MSFSGISPGALSIDLRAKATLLFSEVKDLFGKDNLESRQTVEDYNRFKKLTSDLINKELGRVGAAGGVITNQRMKLLVEASGGTGVTPNANALIFADSIEALFDAADVEGFTIRQRESLEELIRKIRGIATPGQAARPIDVGHGKTLETF